MGMRKSVQTPTEAVVTGVLEVYERGQTVDALKRAEAFAALKNWGGVEACVLAARIATNAGARRLSCRLSLRAWQTNPAHPDAQLQHGFQLAEWRGSLAAWRAMRNWNTAQETNDNDQAELLALHGRLATDLRDFTTAEKFTTAAEKLSALPWIRLQRAYLLERQDRVEEALEIAREATARHAHPFYRPGVQLIAHLLQLLDRDAEAIDLLKQANEVLQSGPIAAQLYSLLNENNHWIEAEAALNRYVAMSPLLEPPLQKWVASQRARVAFHLGKRASAIGFLRELDDEFHKNFSKNLEVAPTPSDRVQLEVSFVRQHFKTCAPATLAALGRYWKMPSEHLKLAEAMCYDGTPSWQQRDWAERNGWLVRDFRVTHESLVTLITAGIPFAISTVEATSAHMQAVVGFDKVRGTILLRDPGQPYVVEVYAENFFKYHRAFGPHGTVFLPEQKRSQLDGIVLPDADIYDQFHCFSLCLSRHDRAGASTILEAMVAAYDGHALTWEARLFLAGYDANVSEQMRCLDKLLEIFPDNANRLLRKLGCLQQVSRSERLDFLQRICASKETDPVLFIELARTLGEDARRVTEAKHWIKRALRFRPFDSNAFTVQADLLWNEGALDEATEIYRFAASLEGYREHLYQSWFSACRRTRRTEEAMALLEDRFKRFGSRSEQPALTLAWALRELDQLEKAREIYNEAVRLRPDNGYLLLNAARLEIRLLQREAADKFLQAAKDKVRRADWLRACADVAEWTLDTATGLKVAREILELEPLALDAHAGVARALAQLEGSAAALAHLKAACARFPHHYGLRKMVVEWSRDVGVEAAEIAVREMLQTDATDPWAKRELSIILAKAGRLDEALQEASGAAEIEPRNSFSHSVLGHLRVRRKETVEAQNCFRRAIELSVDNSDALHALLDLAPTDRERKAELTFIEKQLIDQVVNGDGLLAFRELAAPILEPAVLLNSLRQAYQARPDLWYAWSALSAQLGHLNQLDEALTLAKQATVRFSHMPRTWLDLSQVHQWRQELAAEIEAARHAFEMNPGWNRSTYALANALERKSDLEEARLVYERALQHSPKDAHLRTCLAHLLWRLQKSEAAIKEVEHALRLAPGYSWPWELLREWSNHQGQTGHAVDFARQLTSERPGEMRVWLMLAHVLNTPDTAVERISAVDRALALEPHNVEGWDLKAELLVMAERFDEASQVAREGIRACTRDVFILRGRAAWIEARRRRFPEAVKMMREVLAENAGYVWGWSQLAQWLLEQGMIAEATSALETLQQIRPHDSWVSRQLGSLKLQQNDNAGAKKYFAQALQISPEDDYAARSLLDLQIKADDLAEAEATLRIMQMHQPGVATQAREISVLLLKNDLKAANAVLGKMCVASAPDTWPLEAAADAYRRAGRAGKAVTVFKAAMKSKPCHPQVPASAIHLLLVQRKAFQAVWLFLRLKPGEPQRLAASPLMQGLGNLKAKFFFRWVLWRRRQLLTQDDAAWGHVGYALSNFRMFKPAALWLSDWQKRKTVEPWMLFNLCYCLRQLGRYAESTEIALQTIQRWGHRAGAADLRLFLALEEALAGQTEKAKEHLKHAVARKDVAYDQDLLALANALVEFQQTAPADRLKQSAILRQRLGERFKNGRLMYLMKDVRLSFRRTGRYFIEHGGGWRSKLWFGWKLNWQWSLLPGLLLTAVFPPLLIGLLIGYFSRRNRQ